MGRSMNLRCFVLPLPLLLAAACTEPPVTRVVPLARQEYLPACATVLQGQQLRFVLHDLEPLAQGTLFAWGMTPAGWAPLGTLGPEEVSTLTVTDLAALTEVLVTHESLEAPTTPSASVIFRGRPGESLSLGGYGGPDKETLADATLTATLENQQATLRTASLPYVGTGLHYALWLRHGDGDTLQLGTVGSSAKAVFESDGYLANFDQVVLTLELDAGDDAPGTVLFLGHVLAASASTHPAAAVHEH